MFQMRPESASLMLEIPKRAVQGHFPVNKFGRNPDIGTATDPEDVWDGGGIWVPPTQARVHNLTGAAADASAGTGMRTVKVYGLTSWDTPEVNETVTLNGVSAVATVNSYVIIHRMEGMTFGSGGTNAGAILATAVTDATVTAQIAIGKGQSLMAIYGIPSNQSLYLSQWYIAMNRAQVSAANADMDLLVMGNADQADSGFVDKHHLGLATAGSSHALHPFKPYFKIGGPSIVKVQVENVSANSTDISAGFDGILVGV